jgi:twitching motility protein PilT
MRKKQELYMLLSFSESLKRYLPRQLDTMERLQAIDRQLNDNPEWSEEAISHLNELFKYMVHLSASDMDLGGSRTKQKVWYRVYGNKKPHDELPVYDEDECSAMLLSLISKSQKEILYQNRNVDFAISIKIENFERPYRFRGDIFLESGSLAANFRRIAGTLFNINELGFPEIIVKRFDLEYEKEGLFLITGITGSGKSATLDAIVDMNNRKNEAHIIIMGNPIEFIHESDHCLITHREIGRDATSFKQGTIEALRQDPDIIVVGEMRDPETISTVLEVTDSGHKVFVTLHTSSTVESIHRIVAEFPPSEQERVRERLADTLRVVCSQKLVPNRQGTLTLAKEILSVDDSVRAAIRNNNLPEIFPMISEGRKKGMFTLQQDLYRLVRGNVITQETALNYANNRRVMLQLLNR